VRRGRSRGGLACTTLAKACFNFFKNSPLLHNRHGIRERERERATACRGDASASRPSSETHGFTRRQHSLWGRLQRVGVQPPPHWLRGTRRRSLKHLQEAATGHRMLRDATAQRVKVQRALHRHIQWTCHLHPVHAPVQIRLENCTHTRCQPHRGARVILRATATTHRHIARHDREGWLWSRTEGLQRFPTEDPARCITRFALARALALQPYALPGVRIIDCFLRRHLTGARRSGGGYTCCNLPCCGGKTTTLLVRW
jgi:hypothetical protein